MEVLLEFLSRISQSLGGTTSGVQEESCVQFDEFGIRDQAKIKIKKIKNLVLEN